MVGFVVWADAVTANVRIAIWTPSFSTRPMRGALEHSDLLSFGRGDMFTSPNSGIIAIARAILTCFESKLTS